MTKSKLLKKLKELNPETTIINMYDYVKMDLARYRNIVENTNFLCYDKSFFIHKKYQIKDLINDLQSAEGVNSKVFSENEITYISGWNNVTFRDIYDNIKEISKRPMFFPIFVNESADTCHRYYITHRDKIEAKKSMNERCLRNILNTYTNIGFTKVHR